MYGRDSAFAHVLLDHQDSTHIRLILVQVFCDRVRQSTCWGLYELWWTSNQIKGYFFFNYDNKDYLEVCDVLILIKTIHITTDYICIVRFIS